MITNILKAFFRRIKCPECGSRNIFREETISIAPEFIEAARFTGETNNLYLSRKIKDTQWRYRKVKDGDVYRNFKDEYRCLDCNGQFRVKRERVVEYV